MDPRPARGLDAVPDVMVVQIVRPPGYAPDPKPLMLVRDAAKAWRIDLGGVAASPSGSASDSPA